MAELEPEKKNPKDAPVQAELESERSAQTKLLEESTSTITRQAEKTAVETTLPKLDLVHDHDAPTDKQTTQSTDKDTKSATKKDTGAEPRERESRTASASWKWPWEKADPKVTEDEKGKTTDFGGGHTKRENKDGTGYDRYYDEKTGSWREEHFGPNAKDIYTVNGDKAGNKTTDWHDGHVKQENADGTGYERTPQYEGGTREKHWGPKEEDRYTQSVDKDGNKKTYWGNGHWKIENADGTGYERTKNGDGSSENHWGPKPEDNYKTDTDKDGNKTSTYKDGHTVAQNKDGSKVSTYPDGRKIEEDKAGNKKTTFPDGHTEAVDMDGNKSFSYPDGHSEAIDKNGNKTLTFKDGRKITEDKDGNKTFTYPDGHTRVENKDGTGYEKRTMDDGTSLETHFGPKTEDRYTVSTDLDGSRKTDWGNGHTKVEDKDGKGYEKRTIDDGTTLETHFGPKPEDKYTVSADLDGTRKTDWGNGHVKVEDKDGKGYERIPNPDGSYRVEHFGPGDKDKYTEKFDKDGKKIDPVSKEQEKKATVKGGEGPYQSAQRLLGPNASHKEVLALARALKAAYAAEHPDDKEMRNLKQGENLLTEKNLQQVLKSLSELKGVSPDLAKKIAASLQGK